MGIIITIAAVAVLTGFVLLARKYKRARHDAREAWALVQTLEDANLRMGEHLLGKDAIRAAIRRAKERGST